MSLYFIIYLKQMNNSCSSIEHIQTNDINQHTSDISHLNPVTIHYLIEEPLKSKETLTLNYYDNQDGVLPYLKCYLGNSIDQKFTALLDSGCSQSFISWDILVTIPNYLQYV